MSAGDDQAALLPIEPEASKPPATQASGGHFSEDDVSSDDASNRPVSVKFASLLPRPIENNDLAENLVAHAKSVNRSNAETSRFDAPMGVEIKDRAVIDYDWNNQGWIKYHPDGMTSRLYLRSGDVADLNVYKEGVHGAVIHVTARQLTDTTTSIDVRIQVPDSDRTINVGLLKEAHSDELRPSASTAWSSVSDPGAVRDFCLEMVRAVEELQPER